MAAAIRQLRKAIRPSNVLRILEKVLRFEIADFAADPAVVPFGVEDLKPLDPADAILEIAPERVDVVPDRRDCAQACNDDSPLFHYRVPIPTLCTVWNSFPSVLMEGAMMISVC